MRLFAGIEPSDDVRARCIGVQDRLRQANLDARFEATEKLHLTLAFLGNVHDDRVADVERALGTVAARYEPFDLWFDRVGAFPNERRPRIVWIGSRAQSTAYRELTAATRAAYERLGFSFDDDAIAHVTIARIKGGGARPVPLLDIAAFGFTVREIVLFESLPGQTSTRYTVRARAALST